MMVSEMISEFKKFMITFGLMIGLFIIIGRQLSSELKIEQVTLADDGKTVMIQLPEIQPAWVMEIKYTLKGEDGKAFEGAVQNTIYELEGIVQ